jgi:hypothetical protein
MSRQNGAKETVVVWLNWASAASANDNRRRPLSTSLPDFCSSSLSLSRSMDPEAAKLLFSQLDRLSAEDCLVRVRPPS